MDAVGGQQQVALPVAAVGKIQLHALGALPPAAELGAAHHKLRR